MRKKLKKIWNERMMILKAIYNKFFNFKERKEINEMSIERSGICRMNICGHYDKDGSSPNAIVRGQEACGICGCNLSLMTKLKEANCSLVSINELPLWSEK